MPRLDANRGMKVTMRRFQASFKCLETSLVISNIDTCVRPPKIAFNAESALIMVRFFASCRPFFLI